MSVSLPASHPRWAGFFPSLVLVAPYPAYSQTAAVLLSSILNEYSCFMPKFLPAWLTKSITF